MDPGRWPTIDPYCWQTIESKRKKSNAKKSTISDKLLRQKILLYLEDQKDPVSAQQISKSLSLCPKKNINRVLYTLLEEKAVLQNNETGRPLWYVPKLPTPSEMNSIFLFLDDSIDIVERVVKEQGDTRDKIFIFLSSEGPISEDDQITFVQRHPSEETKTILVRIVWYLSEKCKNYPFAKVVICHDGKDFHIEISNTVSRLLEEMGRSFEEIRGKDQNSERENHSPSKEEF
jgi:hypothetical protein